MRRSYDAGAKETLVVDLGERLALEMQNQIGTKRLWDFLKGLGREVLPPVLTRTLRTAFGAFGQRSSRSNELELKRLRALPPMRPDVTHMLGRPFRILDGHSFVTIYDTFFRREIYAMRAGPEQPFIIDCGANIGVGVIWWKTKYPGCRVLAFEADPAIFAVLQENCGDLPGVRLINAAIWDCDGELDFAVQGGLGGHAQELSGSEEWTNISVASLRLRPYLHEHCDLLKMDIEGAEVRVIRDCADVLNTVDRMFVEYHSFCDKKQYLAETLLHLENAGFRLHIHVELPSPQPFYELLKYNYKDLRLDLYCFRDHVRPAFRTLDPNFFRS